MSQQAKANPQRRGRRLTLTGVVVSDKMDKTRVVQVERLVRHPKYGKYVRKRVKFMAHDKDNSTRVGDRVVIRECRPLSRHKHFRIISILERGQGV